MAEELSKAQRREVFAKGLSESVLKAVRKYMERQGDDEYTQTMAALDLQSSADLKSLFLTGVLAGYTAASTVALLVGDPDIPDPW